MGRYITDHRYILELNLSQLPETKISVMCPQPAGVMYLHFNVLTATQGIMGCYGKRPAVSLYPSPWLFLNVRCSVRVEKAIERPCLYGQHHWLKCPSVRRMTEWLVICLGKQSTAQHLDANEFIKKSKWKRGMHYSSLLLIQVRYRVHLF